MVIRMMCYNLDEADKGGAMDQAIKVLCAVILLIWFSTSATAYWTTEHHAGIWLHHVVADPIYERIFVGTYTGFIYLDMQTGIWKDNVELEGEGRVHHIVLHPEQPDLLILSRIIDFTDGRIEITEDLGASIDTVLILPPDEKVWEIERDPNNPDRLYAITSTSSDQAGGTVRLSEDGGWTWTIVEESATADRWALTVEMGGDVYIGGEDGVKKSEDGGYTWVDASGDMPIDGEIVKDLCVRPNSPAGHVFATTAVDLYETVDGGVHWEPIFGWDFRCGHIIIHDSVPQIMLMSVATSVGPNTFVPISYDGGFSWEYSGYWMISSQYGSLYGMDISIVDNRVYATNDDDVVTLDLSLAATPVMELSTLELSSFPNPFNPTTVISFTLPTPATVSLQIHDLSGGLVRYLVKQEGYRAGSHQLSWDGTDRNSEQLPSGVYIYKLIAGELSESGKLTLIK